MRRTPADDPRQQPRDVARVVDPAVVGNASLSQRVDASSVGQLVLLVTMIGLSSFKPSRLRPFAKARVDEG